MEPRARVAQLCGARGAVLKARWKVETVSDPVVNRRSWTVLADLKVGTELMATFCKWWQRSLRRDRKTFLIQRALMMFTTIRVQSAAPTMNSTTRRPPRVDRVASSATSAARRPTLYWPLDVDFYRNLCHIKKIPTLEIKFVYEVPMMQKFWEISIVKHAWWITHIGQIWHNSYDKFNSLPRQPMRLWPSQLVTYKSESAMECATRTT